MWRYSIHSMQHLLRHYVCAYLVLTLGMMRGHNGLVGNLHVVAISKYVHYIVHPDHLFIFYS